MHGYILCTPTLALDNDTKRLTAAALVAGPHGPLDPTVQCPRLAAVGPGVPKPDHSETTGVMSAPLEQITITSLADEIAFRIQSAILAGEHPPGTRLFQDELGMLIGQ